MSIGIENHSGKISRNFWNRDSLVALKGRVCSLCEVISHAGAEEGHLDFFGPVAYSGSALSLFASVLPDAIGCSSLGAIIWLRSSP